MKRLLNCGFLFFLFPITVFSQSVVISSYFNAADPRDEWTELVVVTDNTDMRGWTIRDDNSSQTSWQTAVTFNNTAFWNNMRAGTIIMLWHRSINSSAVAHTSDFNKADGYIEADLMNTTYFTGGSFGSSPTWAGNTMNIAGGGDVVQLRDASGTHVHALAHISGSTGADWNALPSPKLNHLNNASSGDAIYVCPGDIIADYGTTGPQSGTTWTSKNSVNLTFGLPNISGGSPIQNTALWDTLREPVFANQTVTPSSVVAGNPGSISFSWTAATDPNVGDATIGYLILQNTTNTFTPPADGTTYTTGATLGSATIIAQLSPSTNTSYTDNSVMNGNPYYYRVYAYRYSTDDNNGNTYHRSRGRAYSSTFVDVQQTNPLPVELLRFSGEPEDAAVVLHWETASETNNDYFSVERSVDGILFESIGRVQGSGTSSQEHQYSFTDTAPFGGTGYYRLHQVDFNGQGKYSSIVAVTFTAPVKFTAHCYSTADGLYWSVNSETPVIITVFSASGKTLYSGTTDGTDAGSISVMDWPTGIYFTRFVSGAAVISGKILLQNN